SKGGRLKVYIGSAAGVGKTYRMLHEAHGLKERGVDVVLGFIETHGRAETAVLIDGLEVVPRRRIEYRGVSVEEMDVEAVLARRKSGKIYAADKVPRALENFFTPEKLRSLRELALREVAESVERAPTLPTGTPKARHVSGRVMVCMSSFSPRAAAMLRRGS